MLYFDKDNQQYGTEKKLKGLKHVLFKLINLERSLIKRIIFGAPTPFYSGSGLTLEFILAELSALLSEVLTKPEVTAYLPSADRSKMFSAAFV